MYIVNCRGIREIHFTEASILADFVLKVKFDKQIARQASAFDMTVGGGFNLTP
jgi:hypothetical protein